MQDIIAYFNYTTAQGASDLHLVGDEKPMIRVQGALKNIEEETISATLLEEWVMGMLSEEQKARFAENLELDIGYKSGGVRFRVNLHRQEGKIGIAARSIPEEIPSTEDLRFEPILNELPNLLNGLVLVVGPTGSGKSTTIASMVEEVNKTRKAHIVTIEDPIEFLFKDKESLIVQREVGTDTKSFADALKHVLRQDPNVIVVGEMRDAETISTVLTAAETGHLVFSTLHTSTAAEAIERIVDVFEGSKQKQVLIQLGAVLRAVVAQQLIPTKDGRRVAAREVLINTPAVANLIKENNIAQIVSAMQTGAKDGMITMDNSLKKLVEDGLLDDEVAKNRSGRQKKI